MAWVDEFMSGTGAIGQWWPPTTSTQRLAPDALLTQTNITGAVTDIDEDPDSADALWMTGTGAVVLRVSFPTPFANLYPALNQEFRIRVRPGN